MFKLDRPVQDIGATSRATVSREAWRGRSPRTSRPDESLRHAPTAAAAVRLPWLRLPSSAVRDGTARAGLHPTDPAGRVPGLPADGHAARRTARLPWPRYASWSGRVSSWSGRRISAWVPGRASGRRPSIGTSRPVAASGRTSSWTQVSSRGGGAGATEATNTW